MSTRRQHQISRPRSKRSPTSSTRRRSETTLARGAGRVLPPPFGDEIARSVCSVCWAEWLQQQIRVINHYGLRPALKEDREKLYDITREYFGLPQESAKKS